MKTDRAETKLLTYQHTWELHEGLHKLLVAIRAPRREDHTTDSESAQHLTSALEHIRAALRRMERDVSRRDRREAGQ